MPKRLTLNEESSIALRDVPKILPRRNGKKIHIATVFRWARKGLGGRVLQSRLIGGVRYTTVAALNEFFDTNTIAASVERDVDLCEQLFDAFASTKTS